jgi:hypothetical protein
MTFIVNQTRGFVTSDTRLVDSCNDYGETALLRAATKGNIPVLKVRDMSFHVEVCLFEHRSFLVSLSLSHGSNPMYLV